MYQLRGDGSGVSRWVARLAGGLCSWPRALADAWRHREHLRQELRRRRPALPPMLESLELRRVFSFTPPWVDSLSLYNDTGTPGDLMTSVPVVEGLAHTSQGSPRSLPVEFDLNGDGAPEGLAYTDNDDTGHVTANLSGLVFAEGQVNVRFRAGANNPEAGGQLVFGDWSYTFTFTYVPETPTNGTDPTTHLPDTTAAVFLGGDYEPVVGGATGYDPTDYHGEGVQGGNFAAFSNRYFPTNGTSYTINDVDSNASPSTQTWSDASGSYVQVTRDTHTRQVQSVYNGNGTWTYHEYLTEWRSVVTTFTGAGRSWSLTQDDTHTLDFNASGTGANNGMYSLGEDRAQSVSFSLSIGGAPIYAETSGQGYTLVASGSNVNNSKSESSNYHGQGTSHFTSVYAGGSSGEDWLSSVVSDSDWNATIQSTLAWPSGGNQVLTLNYGVNHNDQLLEQNDRDGDSTRIDGGGARTVTTREIAHDENDTTTVRHVVVSGSGTSTWGVFTGATTVGVGLYVDDIFNHAGTMTVILADTATPGISVSGSTTVHSTAHRVRGYQQNNLGTSTFVSGARTGFSTTASGRNETTSHWHTDNQSIASGTDQSVAGVSRHFNSNHSGTQNGTTHYLLTSSGSRAQNAFGQYVYSGQSDSVQDDTGNYTWINIDSSGVNSHTTFDASGLHTDRTEIGQSSSTDQGSGQYVAHSQGQARTLSGGGTSRTGSSSHSGHTDGSLVTDHDYQTTQVETDARLYNRVQVTESLATFVSHIEGEFHATTTGTGTYTNGSTNSHEQIDRHETGTTSSTAHEHSQVELTDNSIANVHVESSSETDMVSTSDGSYTADGTSINNQVGTTVTWLDASDRHEQGSIQTDTTTTGSQSRDDNSQWNVTSSSSGHSDSFLSESGSFEVVENLSAQGTQGGGASSTIDRSREDSGKYSLTTSSSTHSASDDSSGPLDRSQNSDADDSFDGGGTYSRSSSSHEVTTAGGQYTGTFHNESHSEDSGQTESHLTSDVRVNGTQNSGGSVIEVDFTSHYFEHRNGDQTRRADQQSDSASQFGQVVTSSSESSESHETGSSTFNSTSDSSQVTTTDNYGGEEHRVERSQTHAVSWGVGSYSSDNLADASDDSNGTWSRSSESHDRTNGSDGYDSTTTTDQTLSDTHEAGWSRSTHATTSNRERGSGTYRTTDDRSASSSSTGQNHSSAATSSQTNSSGTTDATFTVQGRSSYSSVQVTGGHWYIDSGGNSVYTPVTTTTTSVAENNLSRRSTGTFTASSTRWASTTDIYTHASSSRDQRSDRGGFTETSSESNTGSIRDAGGSVYSRKSDQSMRASSSGSGTYTAASLNFTASYANGTSESSDEESATSSGSSSLTMNSASSSDISITYNLRDRHVYASKGTVTETRTTSSSVTDSSSQAHYTYTDFSSANFVRRQTDERGSITASYRYNASSSEDELTRTVYPSFTVTVDSKSATKVSSTNGGTVLYTIHLDEGSELARNGQYSSWIDSSSISDSTYSNSDTTNFSTTVKTSGDPDHTQDQSSKTDKTYSIKGSGYSDRYVQGTNGQNTTTNDDGTTYRETQTEKSTSTNATMDITRFTAWPIGRSTKNADSTTVVTISATVNHSDSLRTVSGPQGYSSVRRLEESENFTGTDTSKQNVTIAENQTYQDGATRAFNYTGKLSEVNKDTYTTSQKVDETSDNSGHSLVERDKMSANSTQDWDNSNNSSAVGTSGSTQTFTRNTQTDAGHATSQYTHDYGIVDGVINGSRTRTLGGSGNFVDSVTKGVTVTDTASLDDGTRTTRGTSSHTDTDRGNYSASSSFHLTVTNGNRNEVGDVVHRRSVTKEATDSESFNVEENRAGSSPGHSWTRDRSETRGRSTTVGDTTDTTTNTHIQTGQYDEVHVDQTFTHTQQRQFTSQSSTDSTDAWTGEGTHSNSENHHTERYSVTRGTQDRTHGSEYTHAVTRDQSDGTTDASSGDYDDGYRSGSYDNSWSSEHTRNDVRSGDGTGTWQEHWGNDTDQTWSDTYDGSGDYTASSTSDRAANVNTYGWGTYTTYSDVSDSESHRNWPGGYHEHWVDHSQTSMGGGSLTTSWTHHYDDNYDSYDTSGSSSSPFDPNGAPGHQLSGWEDSWNFFADIADDLSYEGWVAFNSALQAWYNPLGFITGVWDGIIDYVETQVDGTIGVIDGFLNGINPFDAWWSIPDIGPVFGHTEAYFVGQIVGTIGSVVASIMIGNVAGGTSGLIACGSIIQKAAQIYTAVDTVAGIALATQHIYQGNAGISDALAFLPLATMGLQKLRGIETNCFEAGTQVMMVDKDGGLVARNIEDVQVGDQVWGRDEANPDAPMTPSNVTAVYRKTVFELRSLTITPADGGESETLSVTPEHAFYVAGKGWVEAADLAAGERVVGADGREMIVSANLADARPDGVVVYNLNVENGHTYAVADSTGNSAFIWTHNACRLTPIQQLDQALNDEDKARRMLRRQLGGVVDHDAHHLITLDAAKRNEDLMRRAARGGFGINSAENGRMLERYLHGHGHPVYNAFVNRKLARISTTLSDADTAQAVRDLAARLNSIISRYGRPLP